VLGVLTTSNWNGQFYNAAANFSSSIIFYYIAWIFIGNWVLFNLFIAILIQGISEEKKSKFRRQEEIVAEKVKAYFFGLSDEELNQKITDLFNEADSDRSGVIDMNELEFILVKKCDVQIEPKDLVRMFRKYDDDDSGRINQEEFQTMIKELLEISRLTLRKLLLTTIMTEFGKLPEAEFMSKTEEYFKEADNDNSGSVDAKEMAVLLSKHDIEMMPQDIENLLGKGSADDADGGQISQKDFSHMIKLLLTEAEGGASAERDSQTIRNAEKPASPGRSTNAAPKNAVPGLENGSTTAHNDDMSNIQNDTTVPSEATSETENGATTMNKSAVSDFTLSPKSNESQRKEEPRQSANLVVENSEGHLCPDGAVDSDCSDTALSDGATLTASALQPLAESKDGIDKPRVAESTSNGVHREDSIGSGDDEEESEVEEEVVEDEIEPTRAARSLFCLGLENPFRRACIAILDFPPAASSSRKVFDNIILICILISSVALAFENPRIGINNQERQSLDELNLFLIFIFLVECLLKIVADSFLVYLKSGWSRMDFFIVVTSTLDMVLTFALAGQSVSALKTFRVLRILRALRPLRLIARARSLRILLSALWASIIPIIGTCAIAIVAFAMCSLLGMQLLKGKMKSCSDSAFIDKRDCLANVDQFGVPLKWTTALLNWDSLWDGILSMFILASQDNWQVYMVSSIFLKPFAD
jgi:Ca2+-binding EF-hand superfamily protein